MIEFGVSGFDGLDGLDGLDSLDDSSRFEYRRSSATDPDEIHDRTLWETFKRSYASE